MKRKLNWLLVILVALTCAAVGWTANAQRTKSTSPPLATPTAVNPIAPAAKPQWEYKIVAESEKADLNTLGVQGWELVTVTNGGAEEVYYFKRPR